jgi:hypothetical protein
VVFELNVYLAFSSAEKKVRKGVFEGVKSPKNPQKIRKNCVFSKIIPNAKFARLRFVDDCVRLARQIAMFGDMLLFLTKVNKNH